MTNYKPPRANSSSNVERTVGKLRVKADLSAVQMVSEEGVNVTFKTGNFPDYISTVMGGQEFMFTISDNKEKLFGLKPVMGMFRGKVVGFIGDGDNPPTPRTKSYQYSGNIVEYQYFLANIVVTAPEEYAGCVFTHMLRYNYRMAEDEKGRQVVGYASKGKHTEHLIEFDAVTGIWQFGPMPWSENILPAIEKRTLKADQEFQFSMKEGWINDVYPVTNPPKSEVVDGFDDEELDDGFSEDTLVDPGWDEETNSDKVSDEELPWDDDAPF